MSLPAGARLGVYEVLGSLGAGGMGEVYRARDTRLQRDVALKILPAAVATDPDRLARFEREARVLASLNHPGIAQIFGLEESGDVRALVMELVEGQSLDRVIPAGGLPVERILVIAGAIAAALGAAHDKGIVHRDLKPANVMVTGDGRVKVLDFGLAKEVRATNPGDATFTSAGQTAIGIVMGTPAYMSPEQVAGRPVDHRSDIFALGVLIYEMATGTRPFAGASSAELASSILRDAPAPVTDLRADLPADLSRIVRRCLEKDPRDRLQTAQDVGLELRDLGRHGSGPSTPGTSARTDGSPASGPTRGDDGFRVAVLPFTHHGADAAIAAFADGLTEEIVTGLSRFTYLRVIAYGTTRRYAGETAEVRTVGRSLGARYVMSGTVRQAGPSLRVSAQLVDVETGANLWAETYTREFRAETVFALQDDLVPRIVSTVADNYGVLMHSMSEALRHRSPEELSPHEAVLRGYGYYERINANEHREVRDLLERVIERVPGNADCLRLLATLYVDEFRSGFNPRPDPLGRALATARRAVEAGPSNAAAHLSLAVAHFFRKEFPSFRFEVERALALNPLDGGTMAFSGVMLAFAGEWERGCALAARARELNPHHPGWFWFAAFFDAYRRGEYREALSTASKFNLPGHPYANVALAASCGQLGETRAGREAVRALVAQHPAFATNAREELGKWYDAELVEHLVDGLRKAGLAVSDGNASAGVDVQDVPAGPPAPCVPWAPAEPAAGSRTPSSGSGPARQDEGFWVAVLPFRHRGDNADLMALAEGLSEDVVTGLSRFSYLRVIARSSTKRYADQAADVRTVGRDLGARYVMEGNLRQAGSSLRLTVQLLDAETGAHLWADTYNRSFDPAAVFDLQDDLVPRIVSTIADLSGVLPHTMSEALRTRGAESLSPYEAVLRSFGALRRVTAEEHAATRDALERAVQDHRAGADAWAMLSMIYVSEYSNGFNARPDPLDRALDAARRAVDAAPSSSLAHNALAQALFFRRELTPFRTAAERAIALNPMDAYTVAYMGILLAYAGDWDRGCALADRSMQLSANHPGWYRFGIYFNAYRRGDYRAALNVALSLNMPRYFYTYAALAAAHGQLGEREAAEDAVRKLLTLEPGFAAAARTEYEKWFGAGDLVEDMLEGLRKAGLSIPEAAGAVGRTPSAALSDSGRAPVRATAETRGVAIAVLPFSDLSSAKDQEYLCEGMAEEIMNALVRVDGIRVASRGSAFHARQHGRDLKAIAEALSVGHVLEGSVRTSGTRLRVTAQLTEVASGYHLWSERFDRDAVDVFAVQDEIAAGVVEAVKARLGPGVKAVQARVQTANLEAYRWYLKGRHLRHAKEDHGGAMRAFEEAVRLDPGHAPSWTALAESALIAAFSVLSGRDACARARKALATAVALEGESADSLDGEALVAMLERRWPAMEATWRRALALQPDHVRVLGSFGVSLCFCGKREEGLRLLARARELDPLASFPYMLTGFAMLHDGRPQDALGSLDDALSFEREDLSALQASSVAHIALGHFEEGLEAIQRAVDVTGRAPHFVGVLGWALAMAGRTAEARALLAELQTRPPEAPSLVSEAWLLGALGQMDEAFDVLARAEAELHPFLCFNGFPCFDPLRGDPRFGQLLERVGLPI